MTTNNLGQLTKAIHSDPSPHFNPGIALLVLGFSVSAMLTWSLVIVATALIISAAIYFLRFKPGTQVIDEKEEIQLWRALDQATLQGRTTRIPLRLQDQRTIAHTEAASRDRRSVLSLFETLREDQGVQVTPVGQQARSHPSSRPVPSTRPTDESPTASFDRRGRRTDDLSWTMDPLIHREPSEQGTPSTSALRAPEVIHPWLHEGPADHPGPADPTIGVVQPWPRELEHLPSEIRMDVAKRLETDLEWARPQPRAGTSAARVPRFMRRMQAETQAREYARLSRQAELAKSLMHAPQIQLQKKGVELADRLEKHLHERRSRHRYTGRQK